MAEEKGTEATSQPAKGKKGRRVLNPKRARLLKALTTADSLAEAGKIAGYGTRQSAHRAIKAIRKEAPERLEELGITRDRVFKKLEYLMDARETKFFQKDGLVMETRDVEALDINTKAAVELGKMHRAYPRNADSDTDPSERGALEGITFSVVILNEGDAKRLSAGITARRGSHQQPPLDAAVHQNAG